MPEIFSSTIGEAPKIIPTITIVEAEEHDSEVYWQTNKQIKPCDSTAQEVSALEWSFHGISYTDST